MPHVDLQRVVSGVTEVGQVVSAKRVVVLEEVDFAVEAVDLVVGTQFARLPFLDESNDVGIVKRAAAGEHRENSQRLASRDVAVVCRIEYAGAGLGEETIA